MELRCNLGSSPLNLHFPQTLELFAYHLALGSSPFTIPGMLAASDLELGADEHGNSVSVIQRFSLPSPSMHQIGPVG